MNEEKLNQDNLEVLKLGLTPIFDVLSVSQKERDNLFEAMLKGFEANAKEYGDKRERDGLIGITALKTSIPVHSGTDSLFPKQRVEVVQISSIEMKISELDQRIKVYA